MDVCLHILALHGLVPTKKNQCVLMKPIFKPCYMSKNKEGELTGFDCYASEVLFCSKVVGEGCS